MNYRHPEMSRRIGASSLLIFVLGLLGCARGGSAALTTSPERSRGGDVVITSPHPATGAPEPLATRPMLTRVPTMTREATPSVLPRRSGFSFQIPLATDGPLVDGGYIAQVPEAPDAIGICRADYYDPEGGRLYQEVDGRVVSWEAGGGPHEWPKLEVYAVGEAKLGRKLKLVVPDNLDSATAELIYGFPWTTNCFHLHDPFADPAG